MRPARRSISPATHCGSPHATLERRNTPDPVIPASLTLYVGGMPDLPHWTPRRDSDACRASSVALARAVLAARDELTPAHLREALKVAVWKYTESDGKYSTRYRSEAALDAPSQLVHHEHVTTRRSLVDQMIAEPANVEKIMSTAIGCVVLRSEHATLGAIERANPSVMGWDRYRLAGITVWDLAERQRVT